MEHRDGGCLCGQVRFRATGEPARASVCHCRYCQLRTGSAFGVSVYFPAGRVTVLSGRTDTYEHPTQSGNHWTIQRCSQCGTSVLWTISGEAWAGLQGISGGCFDPPTFWYDLKRELFIRSRAGFCSIEAPERHDTHPAYSPVRDDAPALSGGGQRGA